VGWVEVPNPFLGVRLARPNPILEENKSGLNGLGWPV